MKLHAVIAFTCLLGACTAIPIHLGILASNSNELLRLNGLAFSGVGFGQAQTAPFLPPYVIQPGADIGLPFNTQVAGPYLPQNPSMVVPSGSNPLNPVLFPPGQQEPPQGAQGPQDPNAPQQPKAPSQMVPGYYPTMPFAPRPGVQRYPYYYYRYPQPNPNMVLQPTQGVNQMNFEQTTQTPQLPLQVSQTQGQTEMYVTSGTESRTSAPPPERHGDTPKNGVDDGHSSFSFLFEP